MGYNFSKTSNSLIATLDTEDGKYDEHIIECFQPNILLGQERIVLKESSLRVQDFIFESIGQINGETPTNLIDGFEMLESFIKSIFVEESVSTLKTSGTINLNGSFQVLPFDINSCSFSGGKAFLPTTTENGKEILVIAVANNIEIRANSAGTNFMFQTFNTFIPSVVLTTFQMYRFTYIGFGGYWKAELITAPAGVGASQTYKSYIALINQSGTNAPIATVIYNDTGSTFTWNYDDVGSYIATSSSPILLDSKTVVFVTARGNSGNNQNKIFGGTRYNDTSIGLFTSSDGIFKLNFEIRVYN